ncbi:MAG TPA: multicopper oxidase domain-containing protein [Stellaceae bacterium]|nr:multicopper oxidase domain-containing protein [Stellaceae bacterium]
MRLGNQRLGAMMDVPITRRRVITGAAALGIMPGIAPAFAAPPVLRLSATSRSLVINGSEASALALATGDGKIARFVRGERFNATLENRLDEPTLVHWHGLTPPSAQDGTPELSQPPLPPGNRYAYDFPLRRAGTFWMHSHVGFQRARLMAAPLIVEDPAEKGRDEQEVVLFLADFTFRAPEELFAALTRGHGAMAGMDHGHMGQMHMDHGAMDHAHMHHGGMAGDMAMGMDINDVDFDAYLASDRTLDDPEVVRVEPAGRVRLRVINAAAGTNFWIDLGALSGELIAVDGDPVMPVKDQRFPVAMAQRLDIRLAPPAGEGAYPILALREGASERTGIILATKNAQILKAQLEQQVPSPPLGIAFEERLRAAAPLRKRKTDRVIRVDLTGDMMRFTWGINGKRYGEDKPLRARAGERVELVLRNRTMMAHPMHLHGHHFQVLAINDRRFSGAMRDTVLVPAMGGVTVAFDSDNPGKWALHCHNEYHMMAGMMTSLQYES